MCCYASDGGYSISDRRAFAYIPYLAPSHSDWRQYPSLGQLGHTASDFHIKNVVHEMTHAGQWIICDYTCRSNRSIPGWLFEGLAEYEGNIRIEDRQQREAVRKLADYVTERNYVFFGIPLGDTKPTISVAEAYFGGSLFLKYLADRFGESIHYRLIERRDTLHLMKPSQQSLSRTESPSLRYSKTCRHG